MISIIIFFLINVFCYWLIHSHTTHKEAVVKVLTVPVTMQDIGIQLVSQMESERADNRHCFLKIISALKFLAQQGIAL